MRPLSRQVGLICAALWVTLLAGCSGQLQNTPPAISSNNLPPTAMSRATPTQSQRVAAPAGCTVVSPDPTPGPTLQSLYPDPDEADWRLGPQDAAVTIMVYSDFQCTFCAQLAPTLAVLQEKYGDDLQIVFRHYPLIGTTEQPLHDKAALSAQAAEAAGVQGKFWEMHDLLFSQQEAWASLPAAQFETWLMAQANALELDGTQFSKDLKSPANIANIQATWEQGVRMKLPGTPFVLINGQIWPNTVPLDEQNISTVIDLTLLEKRQFSECPPMTIDQSKRYVANMETAKGKIVLELFADKTPLAVNNFIFLARIGWYNGVTFHRVLPGFVAQAGDPTGTGFGGPGYAFDNEITPDLVFDREGLLAMANAGPGSNGSQFFITYSSAMQLNGGYTIFGQVLEGMDVLRKLTPRDPGSAVNLPPGDKIIKIVIEEK